MNQPAYRKNAHFGFNTIPAIIHNHNGIHFHSYLRLKFPMLWIFRVVTIPPRKIRLGFFYFHHAGYGLIFSYFFHIKIPPI